MANGGPSKSYRKGISVMEMAEMFGTETAAVEWFEGLHWPDGEICCLRCGGLDAYRVKSGKPMPYRCRDCGKYFSLKTGTAMEDSKLPLRLWAWAIYLEMTNLKGVSSVKLGRDLKIRQASAWFMLHRIREAFVDVAMVFEGPVEVDETYFGAVTRVLGLAPNDQQVGDGGIDGVGYLFAKPEKTTDQVLAQVKGGKYKLGELRDFMGVLARERAAMGVYTTVNPISAPGAQAEAARRGNLKLGANEYPGAQLWSIQDYFDNRMPILPALADPYTGKEVQVSMQMAL